MPKTDQDKRVAMSNLTEVLTIDDVKSHRDEVQFLNQECVSTGLTTTLVTFLGGVVGIPLLFKKVHHYIPFQKEYKIAASTVTSIIISYFAGVAVKKRCEENLKKQLAEKLHA